MSRGRNIKHTCKKLSSKKVRLEIINFQKKVPVASLRIKKIILKTLSEVHCKKLCEITVCFTDDEKIKELNSKFHHCNAPTDVLTFDLCSGSNKMIVADIVVSAETAITNAKRFGTSCNYELGLYVVHGVLHLLGYDDKAFCQRNKMQKKAEMILGLLNYK